MRGLLCGFLGARKASTAIEYGLISGLIALVMIEALNALGSALNGAVITIGTGLSN